eukprot:522094-Rhodomonas_salina.2
MMTCRVTTTTVTMMSTTIKMFRLRGTKFSTPAFSDTNQTLTGRPEASFRSTTVFWDWRMYHDQAQLNYYIYTYAHLHCPKRLGSGGKVQCRKTCHGLWSHWQGHYSAPAASRQ